MIGEFEGLGFFKHVWRLEGQMLRDDCRSDRASNDEVSGKTSLGGARTYRVKPVQVSLYAYKTPGFTQCLTNAARSLSVCGSRS